MTDEHSHTGEVEAEAGHGADEGTRLLRASYDAVSADYAERFLGELEHKPLDRALLSVVLEEAGGSPIGDIGCGPGHVAGWLAAQGGRAVGIDLSPAMIDRARRAFPGVEYRVGDMRHLPAADDELAAAVAFYSLIHVPTDDLASALAEIDRAVVAGGPILVAFHLGDEVVHRDEWFGHEVSLDFRMMTVEDVSLAMEQAGLRVEARLERDHYGEVEGTATTRVYLLARR